MLTAAAVWNAVWQVSVTGAHRVGGTWGGTTCYAAVTLDAHLSSCAFYLAVSVLAFFWLDIRRRWSSQAAHMARLAGPRAFERSVVDVGFGLLLVAMLLAQVVFKTATETLLYLVQPCHLVCLACAVMLLRPRPWMAPLTNALLPWMMGAWAAILMPDTEELKMPYEVEIFFLEHALITAAPFYLLVRQGGLVARTTGVFSSVLGSWTMFLYHCAFAQPLGLLTGVNLNYMLCPTPSLSALILALFPPEHLYPSYHTPVYIMVPLLGQTLHSLYLAPARLYTWAVAPRQAPKPKAA